MLIELGKPVGDIIHVPEVVFGKVAGTALDAASAVGKTVVEQLIDQLNHPVVEPQPRQTGWPYPFLADLDKPEVITPYDKEGVGS